MQRMRQILPASLCLAVLLGSLSASFGARVAGGAAQQTQQPAAAAGARPIGTIKAIVGGSITLVSDAGPTFNVAIQDVTRLLRIEPGEKDLKNAQPVHLDDLQVGDRILVTGRISDDGHAVTAASVIVMKKADVETKQQHDLQDWQRRGVGGLVSGVDTASGTITISATSLAGSKTIAVHISKDTVLRRYAPDSVKFDDAKPSSLDQIKAGDQLRARGPRDADGNDMTAEEIVTGAFRNIAGTILSVDSAANAVAILDLITKKPVTVKISPASQMRKLSPQMAQLLALRLKGGQPGSAAAAAPSSGGQTSASTSSASPAGRSADGRGTDGRGGPPAGRGGGGAGADLQQLLSRAPAATLSDLQKGDAVMIVSTEGTAGGAVTAITLVGGVEPILQASPNGNGQGMVLPPWSLDAPGDAGGQ